MNQKTINRRNNSVIDFLRSSDKRQIIKVGILGISLIVIANLLVVTLYLLLTRSTIKVLEARLNPSGEAYEINQDDMGRLWISDFSSKEIWGVDTNSSTYQIYPVPVSPVDARQAGGWLWWAAGIGNNLGRISISDGEFSEWQIPDAPGFLGTNLDDQGRLYATDSSNPYLYRLDPSSNQLCVFTLPGIGAGNYIIREGDYLWMNNYVDSIIMRFQISNDQLTWWALPENSSPFGMASDEQGKVWYADSGRHAIVRFDPLVNQLYSYDLPESAQPEMLAVQSGSVWYTEQNQPILGRLYTENSPTTVMHLTQHVDQFTNSCMDITPLNTGYINATTGKLSWNQFTYHSKIGFGKLQFFNLPEPSKPQGIAFQSNLYAVDRGRQVLIWVKSGQ